MSGHSKWSTIKRKKGMIDGQRSKVFMKLAKEIYVAAKSGDKDPANNAALRMVIEKAKSENMPKNNIQNAIDKAHSKSNNESYDSIRYEGYGPSGIAIIIDCLTDNKNRTASFVRSTLTKRGGKLGTDGSVSYLFNRRGLIILEKVYDVEKIMEDIIEMDIVDFIENDDNFEIITEPDKFLTIKNALDKKGYTNFLVSEVTFIPDNYIALAEDEASRVMNLIDELEDIDDVQNVYHNLEI